MRCKHTAGWFRPEAGVHRLGPFTEAGNATFNVREGAHGNLVLALALTVSGLSRPEFVTTADLKVTRE